MGFWGFGEQYVTGFCGCTSFSYVLLRNFNISFPLIGRENGGRDHTTVIHSCEKVKHDIETDVELAQEVEQIRAMLST
jgi:chromosomal replication initiation ATPase DnaA